MDQPIAEDIFTYVKSHYFGKYRGFVTDTNDPTSRGRIKVKVPPVLDDQEVWAMPCVPYAGNGIGSYMIPETGSGIWVEFEGGDPSFPVWTGCYWADNELPEDNSGARAQPSLKIIRTESGLMLTMDDRGQEITVSDENGDNVLTIEVQKGQITLKGNIKAVVEAPKIELVENSTHPVVFGDELFQYLNQIVFTFNAHMHPGQLALGVFPVTPMTPVAPFSPPSPTMLSKKVTSG